MNIDKFKHQHVSILGSIATLRRLAKPLHALGHILGHAGAQAVADAELFHGRHMILCRCQTQPFQRLRCVLRHPRSLQVAHAQLPQGIYMALGDRLAKPLHPRRLILGKAVP